MTNISPSSSHPRPDLSSIIVRTQSGPKNRAIPRKTNSAKSMAFCDPVSERRRMRALLSYRSSVVGFHSRPDESSSSLYNYSGWCSDGFRRLPDSFLMRSSWRRFLGRGTGVSPPGSAWELWIFQGISTVFWIVRRAELARSTGKLVYMQCASFST